MTDEPDHPLYAKLDKACEALLDRVFPVTIAEGGQDHIPQAVDVKDSVAALRFVKDYLQSRHPQKGASRPPKKGLIGEIRDQLNGRTDSSRRSSGPKAASPSRNGVARIAVDAVGGEAPGDGDDEEEPARH